MINLDQFEQEIDTDILKRGYQYFKKGLVSEPNSTGIGEYEFEVDGTEDYIVELRIVGRNLVHATCTCPYDWGAICKHIAASVICLENEKLELETKPNTKSKEAKKSSPKRKASVENILNSISHEELKEYITRFCNKDKKFKAFLLAEFAHLFESESIAYYEKKIKTVVSAASSRGYIDYYNTSIVFKGMEPIMLQAENALTTQPQTSFYICIAAFRVLTKVILENDDSSGNLSWGITMAQEYLAQLSKMDTEDNLRKEMIDTLLKDYDKRLYSGWDWDLDLITFASDLARTPEEIKEVHNYIDKIPSSGNDWDYDYRQGQNIRYKLIKKWDSKEKAKEYLYANIQNPDFRTHLIQELIDNKQYEEAIDMCQKGIISLNGNYAGIAHKWQNIELEVYKLQNDSPKIIELAETIFLSYNDKPKQLFDTIKSLIPKTEWKEYLATLIEKLQKKNRYLEIHTLANIYVWENDIKSLWSIIKTCNYFPIVQSYDSLLWEKYPVELTELYEKLIYQYLENNVSRSHYKTACSYLNYLIKKNQTIKVKEIIDTLKSKYIPRRALQEELAKIKL